MGEEEIRRIKVRTKSSGEEEWDVHWFTPLPSGDLFLHLTSGENKLFLSEDLLSAQTVA